MTCEIGMIGLGVMGRNFLLNIADHNHVAVGFDMDSSKIDLLLKEGKGKKVYGAKTIAEFIALLAKPRIIMLLVPAGAAVDAVIEELIPHLEENDIIIDSGNSYYKDTEVRNINLAKRRLEFMGVGISGGEEGARIGPSLMPGGTREAYEHIRPIFEDCAAKVNGEPCVAYLGPRSSGHYVKMVHNGIEYGIMQLISETYDFLKRGLGFNDEELSEIYVAWDSSEVKSYLIEITSRIFTKIDDITKKLLIDQIVDVAKQLGTGMWTSQSAMELQVPVPTIDSAVDVRNLSMLEDQRARASVVLKRPIQPFKGDRKKFVEQLRDALYVAMIITYAQGMALLSSASDKLKYDLNLESIARIWRGGCIIRASLLEDIRVAYKKDPHLPNLLLDEGIAKKVMENEDSLRKVVSMAVSEGIPIPCFTTSLSYLDGYRSGWLPANLIQAQRDYFGSHTYERKDTKGTFHTNWESTEIYEN